ncbi:MAG: general secretion pathway protein GspF [Gammaproteobacteria bacterium]|nr:MAG: general secretion pathway protein GspF [Gammaproteobacteria bacterium]
MAKRRKYTGVDEPLRHRDHARPVTRRDFLRQGFISGSAYVLAGGAFSLLANPRQALARVSSDLQALASDLRNCNVGGSLTSRIPFICFDLGGGANFAASNVIVGQQGGQMAALSTAGYSKMGLPGDIIPASGLSDSTFVGSMLSDIIPTTPGISNGDFTNSQLGLRFHTDSPMLAGILERFQITLAPNTVQGAVIPARSDNDTGNNPHNPMYAIAKAGAGGDVVTLIGSQNTESGGNSMAPAAFIQSDIRPTKVDRPSDVTGMVDVGDLTAVLSDPADVTAVMESIARVSHKKLRSGGTNTGIPSRDEVIKDLMQCGYINAADIAQRFAGRSVNPDDRTTDRIIVGDTNSIFTEAEFDGDREFRKTASVMKMVIDGNAGAGCITMGGYDYHTGDRTVGENRDLRAGRCIGACLEYARRSGQPLMIYVFSDGSVASNGRLDNMPDVGTGRNIVIGGRGKGEWTGDNSSTACSFFLVFDPLGGISQYVPADPRNMMPDPHQIGWFSADGSVVTSSSPAANNVNLLVNTVMANYMSLNGRLDEFATLVPNHGLGIIDRVISFGPMRSAPPL